MACSEEIVQMAKENNGIVTASMVSDAGISRGNLKDLADKGKLEKVSRGVYVLPESWEDEFINAQSRYKKGIFSLETALFLHDLTDRTPNKLSMTFPSTYNLTSPKNNGICCNSSKEPVYSLGITEVETPGGNMVRAYNVERTLCDLLKPRNESDIQMVTEAFKRYTSGNSKNIPLLSEYAKTFKVDDKLRSYLEVLL